MADRLLQVLETLRRERETFVQQVAMFRSGVLSIYVNDRRMPAEDSARDAERRAKHIEHAITRVEEVTYGAPQTVFEVLQ